MKRKPYRGGYSDDSGEEYIVVGDSAKLALRWGCECCKDTSPLTREEIAFRDRVVKALNNYDRIVRMLRRLQPHISAKDGRAVQRLLKDLKA